MFYLSRILFLFSATLVSQAVYAAEPDYEKLKTGWEEVSAKKAESMKTNWAKQKDQRLDELNGSVESNKKSIKVLLTTSGKKKAQIEADRDEADKLRKQNEEFKDRIIGIEVEKKKPPEFKYAIDPFDLKADAFGKLGEDGFASIPPVFKVLQIQDESNSLMIYRKKTYWMQMPTKGFTDGDKVEVTQFVHCLGTKTYQSQGGKRTVLELKIVK